MANTPFQSNNGAIIIDNTTISTPSNILIKGVKQNPERKNLFSKSLFQGDSQMITVNSAWGNSGDYLQRYGSIVIFSNKGSDARSYIQVQHNNLKGWLGPTTADQKYTITFKINRVENLKDSVNLAIMNGSTNISITSETKGIISKTGTFSQWVLNNNAAALLAIDIGTNNILVTGEKKETLIEIELISFELGDHINDPLLYMPETPYENSIFSTVQETPLISSNNLTTLGDYRLEGEVSLFLQQIEKMIEDNYDSYKPSKRELNITYTLSRR